MGYKRLSTYYYNRCQTALRLTINSFWCHYWYILEYQWTLNLYKLEFQKFETSLDWSSIFSKIIYFFKAIIAWDVSIFLGLTQKEVKEV